MNIDNTLSAEANLCALINADNPDLELTPETVSFGTPAERTPSIENTRNTTVELTTVGAEPKSDTVRYTRLDLTESVETVTTEFAVETATTLAELKTEVATTLKLVPSEFELVGDLPEAGQTATIVATPKEGSLLYMATTLDLTVTNTDTAEEPQGIQSMSLSQDGDTSGADAGDPPVTGEESAAPEGDSITSDVTDPQKETA